MRLNSLYAKLAVSLALLFAVLGVLFFVIMRYSLAEYRDAVSQELNRDVATEVASEIRDAVSDPVALKRRIESLMHLNPGIEVYVVDMSGAILAFSAA
ncbi:MAG: sensor histidine kinase, partial [Betaproteobacteria bacterium]|nr:sensor histidine kinase [Betaproteobacteria bacterium]